MQAWMKDEPEAIWPNSTHNFETSIIAKKGADAGLVYAVVRWGFTVDDSFKVTGLPPRVEDRPSPDFGTAVAAWNE